MPVDAVPYCLRLLAKRQRTIWELDQAMERREIAEEQRQATIAQLIELRLVDDELFARSWVRSRDRLSPRGEPVLRMELTQKHVPKPIIDAVLRERREDMAVESTEQLDEVTMARDLVERRMRQYAHLDPGTRNRRLMGFLQRRGFSYDVIRRILE